MSENLRWIVPAPQPIPEVITIQAIAHEFYREVKYREEFEEYCQWYRAIATRHQQELKQMQGDVNLLGWFNRRRH